MPWRLVPTQQSKQITIPLPGDDTTVKYLVDELILFADSHRNITMNGSYDYEDRVLGIFLTGYPLVPSHAE